VSTAVQRDQHGCAASESGQRREERVVEDRLRPRLAADQPVERQRVLTTVQEHE